MKIIAHNVHDAIPLHGCPSSNMSDSFVRTTRPEMTMVAASAMEAPYSNFMPTVIPMVKGPSSARTRRVAVFSIRWGTVSGRVSMGGVGGESDMTEGDLLGAGLEDAVTAAGRGDISI